MEASGTSRAACQSAVLAANGEVESSKAGQPSATATRFARFTAERAVRVAAHGEAAWIRPPRAPSRHAPPRHALACGAAPPPATTCGASLQTLPRASRAADTARPPSPPRVVAPTALGPPAATHHFRQRRARASAAGAGVECGRKCIPPCIPLRGSEAPSRVRAARAPRSRRRGLHSRAQADARRRPPQPRKMVKLTREHPKIEPVTKAFTINLHRLMKDYVRARS